MLELYNENLVDLLAQKGSAAARLDIKKVKMRALLYLCCKLQAHRSYACSVTANEIKFFTFRRFHVMSHPKASRFPRSTTVFNKTSKLSYLWWLTIQRFRSKWFWLL